MAFYDFKCAKCDAVVTVEVRNIKKAGIHPPDCCNQHMQRVWTPVSFVIGGYNSQNCYRKDSDGWAEKKKVS